MRKFILSEESYISQAKDFFLKPLDFPEHLAKSSTLFSAIFLAAINIALGSLIGIIYSAYSTKRLELFFLGVSQFLISFPFWIILLLITACLLFLIARLMGGDSSLACTTKALCFSTNGLILIALPYLNLLGMALTFLVLVSQLHQIHHFSKIQALITSLIPLVFVLFIRLTFLSAPFI